MDFSHHIKSDNTSLSTYYFYCLNKGSQPAMDKMERFFKIDQILRTSRYSVPKARFLEELEVSLATFKRDLEYLRDRMHAPIEYDKKGNGYQYAEGSDFQLPGLWMNEGEIHALLTMQHLLSNLQPGMLDEHVKPLIERITHLLEMSDHSTSEISKRIRILSMAHRPVSHAYFEIISSAVLDRKRLNITYYNRANDIETKRDVSPQRLVHYRDNWYMDTWCHLRNELRTFSVESIRLAELRTEPAEDVDEKVLDKELGSGYGIFTGSDVQQAVLRFKPHTSRWVELEEWHPGQNGEYDKESHYVLSFPYSDDRELIQDILKYGQNVEVIKPKELQEKIKSSLSEAIKQYDV